MKISQASAFIIGSIIALSGCSEDRGTTQVSNNAKSTTTRWYTQEQVQRGDALYQANCAQCHQADASGEKNWRQLDANGKYPPPPLNGTAHAWHHPLSALRKTIEVGGIPLGASMPGFADKLNQQEIDDVLAWVQSHWTNEIYTVWHDRNEKSN